MKAQILSFPNLLIPQEPKTKLRDNSFDVRREYTKFLTRPNGKPLSAIQTLLLDTLKNWAKGGESFTTYKYLLKSKFFHAKTTQTVTRNLEELENYINWTWKKSAIINGRRRFNVILFSMKNTYESDAKDAEEKLKNEALNYHRTNHKCRVKLIKNDEVYIKQTNTNSNNIFPIRKEILLPEERRKRNKKKEEIKNDEVKNIPLQTTQVTIFATPPNCSERAGVALGALNSPTLPPGSKETNNNVNNDTKNGDTPQMNDLNSLETDSKVLIKSENKNNEQTLVSVKEEAKERDKSDIPFKAIDKEYESLCLRQKLNIAIHNKFGSNIHFQLQENLVVKEYTETKVTLQFKQQVQLSSEDKEQLRLCIKQTYGEGVDIVITSGTIPLIATHKAKTTREGGKMFFTAKKDKVWQEIKNDVCDGLGNYKQRALSWLEHNALKVESFEEDKLVIKTTPVCADYIHDICNLKLEASARTKKLSVEVIYGTHKNEKYLYQ